MMFVFVFVFVFVFIFVLKICFCLLIAANHIPIFYEFYLNKKKTKITGNNINVILQC